MIYLFQVEAWRDNGPGAGGDRIREEVRAELRSRMIQEATGRLLQELKKNPKIRIETGRLPFRYVPETSVQVE